MMFVKVCLEWQEFQQRLPCRLAENKDGEGRCRVRARRDEVIVPAERRPIGQCSRQIGATAHQSHSIAAHPPLLVTSHQ